MSAWSSRQLQPVRAARRLQLGRPATAQRVVATPPAGPVAARAVALPPMVGQPPGQIRHLVQDSIVVIAPDWSGSTFAVWGGDPEDAIGAAGESLLLLQRRHGGGAGLVVPWGTSPAKHLMVGPVDVAKKHRTLVKGLRTRVNLGGNDLPAALREVADRLPASRSGTKVSVFVPTDGCEPVTSATHAAVTALPPGSVHLLLIDPLRWCSGQMEAEWRSVDFGSVIRLEKLTVRDLAVQMAQLYATTLGLTIATNAPSPTRMSRLTRKKDAS